MLARAGRYMGPAAIEGRLYRIAHYPGLVLSPGRLVRGDLFAIDKRQMTFRTLDAYEGHTAPNEFKRITAPVLLDSGDRIEAYVYVYMRKPSGLKRIRSGDFLNPRRRSQPFSR